MGISQVQSIINHSMVELDENCFLGADCAQELKKKKKNDNNNILLILKSFKILAPYNITMLHP